MSDIFATLVENYYGVSESKKWLLGEDIYTPNKAGDAMRYMCNPTIDKISSDYFPERYQGTGDSGGVHLNSGIVNLGECESHL